MDLKRGVRRSVTFLVCLFATSCQVETVREGVVVDFDLSEYAYFDPEQVREHRAGVEQRSALRLRAMEHLYVTPRSLRVEAESQAMPDETAEAGEAGQARRARSVMEYDWVRGVVYTSTDGKPRERRYLSELEYESENLYRRNRLDFVNAYVDSPEVRKLPDVEFFLEDRRIEDVGQTVFAGRIARIRRLGVFPGVYWDVWVLPFEATPFESSGEVSAYLVGAMGLPPSRATRIVERLRGVPVNITATLFSGADSSVLVEGFLRDASWRADLPPASKPVGGSAGEDDSAGDDGLEELPTDPDVLLDSVRHLDHLSRGLTPTMVFLKLSEHVTKDQLAAALQLFREIDNAHAQVELARALLRSPKLSAWRRLREFLFEKRGTLAMNLVEALIAEADARALSALMHVLSRRVEFVDVDSEAVLSWALSHLRVLSGMTLAELVEYSSPGAIPDDEPERSSARRSAELDRWLRWWERKQDSVPRF